jgi:phenylalanyl-tRNA synthetase alpha chain
MDEKAKKLIAEAKESIESAMSLQGLEEVRVKYLGKKGEITQALRSLSKYPQEERPAIGRYLNEARETVEGMIASWHLHPLPLWKTLAFSGIQ